MPESFDLFAAHRFRRTPRVLSGGPEDCYVAPVPHLELGLRSRLVFDSDQPCLRFRPAQSTLRLLDLCSRTSELTVTQLARAIGSGLSFFA
jgi:hypothetical protein